MSHYSLDNRRRVFRLSNYYAMRKHQRIMRNIKRQARRRERREGRAQTRL